MAYAMTRTTTKDKKAKWTPERIRRLRRRLKMTHLELAHALGVDQRTVQGWQAGRNEPRGLSRQALDRLAKRPS
jgi:DNA-binding transcriptional regulator YiaG